MATRVILLAAATGAVVVRQDLRTDGVRPPSFPCHLPMPGPVPSLTRHFILFDLPSLRLVYPVPPPNNTARPAPPVNRAADRYPSC